MMRTPIGSAILGIALSGLLTGRADSQIKKPTPGLVGYSSVRFVEQVKWRKVLEAGRDAIQDQDWKSAIFALQEVLKEREDHLVQISEPDPADPKKQITRWVSLKFEANRLLGSMPAAGLKAYEAAHGEQARELLDAAKKKKNSPDLIAEVAQQYRHTKAGREAYEITLKRFKAGIAAEEIVVKDWRSWRGNLRNTGQAIGGVPLLDKKLWSRPLMMDKLDGFDDQDPDQRARARTEDAVKQVRELKQPVLPGFFPIAAEGIMVYRSGRGTTAVALKTIKIKDDGTGKVEEIKPGQIVWKSIPMNRSLGVLLERPATRPKIEQWLDSYKAVPGFSSLLWENTLLGAVSTDGRYVYMIDDLAVPPHPNAFTHWQFQPMFNAMDFGDLKPLVIQNELLAYDLQTGKLKWDLNEMDAQFKNSHFLGQPISVGGKLYVLNERLIDPDGKANQKFGNRITNPIGGESELRLVCIDTSKMNKAAVKPMIVEPIQVLGNVVLENRMVQDIGRRVNAVQMGYSDGVLVCPTNAGEVFGYDLMTRSLAWSYSYRESPHQQVALPAPPGQPKPPMQGPTTTVVSKWKSAPPALQAGKVVFTAPDADSVHCINLKDGKLIWKKAQQKGDLYLAGVVDGRVLIVSESAIRALDLKDGSQLWSIPTGNLPAGQGAASQGIYYLPLDKGEIVAVDVVKGVLKARSRAAKGEAKLGNLVFHDHMVLTQTPTEVIAYPQLASKLE